MRRREFLAAGLGAAAAGLAPRAAGRRRPAAAAGAEPFKLRYAPHFGTFRHHAPGLAEQIAFMAEQGFRAIEDNGMKRRPEEQQEKIRAALDRHGMEMGVFVAHADFRNVTFASRKADARQRILRDVRDAVEVARRVRAKWVTVVPGAYDRGTEWDYQTASVVENLRRACEVCEETGLVMVLEPLNPWTDHPGCFLTKVPQAYMICRAVGHPSCKILFDVYHQQITEGNLIPNIDRAWSEIAYFQVGDNPGRKEPGTGEINYRNVFAHIHGKGYQGIVGMEHGNSRSGAEGELAVIRAYREADSF